MRTSTRAIKNIRATIERPAGAVGQPLQYKPERNDHRGVASEIMQKNAALAAMIAVIRSNNLSVISMFDFFLCAYAILI